MFDNPKCKFELQKKKIIIIINDYHLIIIIIIINDYHMIIIFRGIKICKSK